jgi:translation initiation factor 2 beta subunit (eIF-2beta)/eIF-5
LPSSRSHDEDIGKKKKEKNDSPMRRSILETNEADDSSAAEDNDDKSRYKRPPQNATAQSQQQQPQPQAQQQQQQQRIENYGEIQLTLHYDTNRNKLVIKVNQARDLINTDKDSLSDPYVRIALLPDRKKRTKRKTKIVKDSVTPQWEECFEYDMHLNEAKTKTIDLAVKNDKSLFSREKTFMGQCLISLENIDNLEIGHTEWFKLKDQSVFETLLKKLNE